MSIKLTFSEKCPKWLEEHFAERQYLIESPSLRVAMVVLSSSVHFSAFLDLGFHLPWCSETSIAGEPSKAHCVQF